MKRKNNLKSKKIAILPVLTMLLVGVLSVTSVTYAWFQTGDEATVEHIDVNVQAADGVLVSWTGATGTWGTYLDITNKPDGAKYVKPETLNPVSTTTALNASNRPDFYVATLQNNGTSITSAADSTNFIYLDFYVKLDANYDLYLSSEAYVGAIANANGDTKSIDYSARVGFVNHGYTTYTNSTLGTFTVPENNSMVIWEPSHSYHISSANLTDRTPLSNGALEYYGIKAASGDTPFVIYGEENKTYSTPVTTYTTAQLTSGTEAAPATPVLSLKAGVNKVSVYIWVEGQDVDCLNDVAGSALSTLIKLTKLDPTTRNS